MRNLSRVIDEPIIQSLLDTDFYKYPMQQLNFHKHRHVPVKFTFMNRHKHVRLGECLDLGRLRAEFDSCLQLRYVPQDIHYLLGTYEYRQPMFEFDFVEWLQNFQLPEYHLETYDGQLVLEFAGEWPYASHWETLSMEIIDEVYGEYLTRDLTQGQRERMFKEGRRRLMEKIRFIKQNPYISFSDFGTRRRFARFWQEYVVATLAEEFPKPSAFVDNAQFRGTSNVWLARQYGLTPTGTNAHEEPMGYSAIYRDEDNATGKLMSQIHFLEDWQTQYGLGLSIFLPDTYGTDYFLSIVPEQMLREWKGSRQDSGSPKEYGEKWIATYRSLGIESKTKLMICADGQDPWQMDDIERHFRGRITTSFGWGTNCTNDLGLSPAESLKALSVVVKMTEACGVPTCKLSDNIEKATGNPQEIERMKQLVSYTNTYSEATRY